MADNHWLQQIIGNQEKAIARLEAKVDGLPDKMNGKVKRAIAELPLVKLAEDIRQNERWRWKVTGMLLGMFLAVQVLIWLLK